MNAAKTIINQSVLNKLAVSSFTVAVVECCLVLALIALSAHRPDARAAVTNNLKLETVGKVARWVSLDRSTEVYESRRYHSSTFAGWNDVCEVEWRKDGGRVVW